MKGTLSGCEPMRNFCASVLLSHSEDCGAQLPHAESGQPKALAAESSVEGKAHQDCISEQGMSWDRAAMVAQILHTAALLHLLHWRAPWLF